MSTTIATTAALIIFHGYDLAPRVAPSPPGYTLICDHEMEAFKQLVAYLAHFKELKANGHAWQPFITYNDGSKPMGVALAPWLRGGARYLQSILARSGMPLDDPESLGVHRWFAGIQAMAQSYAFHPADKSVGDCLHAVRSLWDYGYTELTEARALYLVAYYSDVQNLIAKFGLESNANRIAYMKRKNRIASL